MDDVNQAATVTKPRRRMFSTAASQGALCGALSGLLLGLILRVALPLSPHGRFVEWLDWCLPFLAAIAIFLTAAIGIWFVERSDQDRTINGQYHRGKVLLNRFIFIGSCLLVMLSSLFAGCLLAFSYTQQLEWLGIVVLTPLLIIALSLPLYLAGLPGFKYRSSTFFLGWTLVCVGCGAVVFYQVLLLGHLMRFRLTSYQMLMIHFGLCILTAVFRGIPACPLWGRGLSATTGAATLILICLPVFVLLPNELNYHVGYPELAVMVLGGPLMGFVSWGLMDWFAKRAAGEKG
jgi:hypothetical protein